MRPRTETLPTRRVGASASGAAKDVLISIRVSLTVGSRWRTRPGSHAPPAGTGACADCANRSAGALTHSAAAADPRKNSRRSNDIWHPPSPQGELFGSLVCPQRAAAKAYFGRLLGCAPDAFANEANCR